VRRRLPVALMAVALLVAGAWSATAFGSATDGRGAFMDDDGSVHEADINGLGASGITKGCNPPANTFYCPDQSVTREQMASFLVRALDLPAAEDMTFADTTGSVHQADIAALAQAGITKGCNPPNNTNYCPTDPVTREQMASFLVRALDDVDAILNRLSIRAGITCTKDGLTCSGRATLATGVQLEVREGWYQVLPYRSGEQSAFNASNTQVTFTWDGTALGSAFLGLSDSSSPATRTWRVRPPTVTPGIHTLRAVWRWQGAVTQTVTYVITGA
jgi:hypothetical protein